MRHIELNNEIMIRDEQGFLQFDKDAAAAQAYFIDYVNQNTVFFHDLREKLDFLIENDYYEKELLEQYTFTEIKSVYKTAYAKKFRFPSFMSAFKFYNDYALKTNDGKKILERYEDRISICALFFGKGDAEKARKFAQLLINQEYQPATPTFLNAGRKRRGELVSCFLLEVGDSLNDINMAEATSKQLSKVGGGVSLNLSKIRAKGESIKDIEGVAKGVVGVMKSLDNAFRYADQMGQRPGAGAAYLNVFHADINDFLDTKKISADEDVRVKTLSIGVVIPDKFIELAREGKPAYVFYPHTVYKAYGEYLDEMDFNEMYDKLVDNPAVRKDKINPRALLEKIAAVRFESGYPYIMFEGNVNNVHALGNVGKVTHSNLCVTGDTLLLTNNGYERADTLFEAQTDLKVVIDDRTKEMELADRGTSIVDAIPMHLTKMNADVFKVVTRQGFEIKATEWHKFYVKRDGNLIKIPLNEIKEGDRVLVQSSEGAYGTKHNPKLAYLMGVIAGDGTYTDNAVKIYLYDNKRILADRIEKYVADVIVQHPNLREYKHNTSFTPKFNETEGNDRLNMSSTVLYDILAEYGFHRGNKTDLPKFIEEADKETQAAYLSGYFQMDGCANANFACSSLSVELTSTNLNGLQGVQRILLNMGVYSTIYASKNKGRALLPDGKGGQRHYDVKPTHRITIQDREARERFVSIVEMKEYDMYKFNLLTETLQAKSRRPKHDYTAEVVAIEYYGKEDVFDTTQPDYSSLIFNGIVTGNCSEILQASEVSTYTDYGKEDELGLDISCNLASLNILNVMANKSIEQAVKLGVDALTLVSDSTNIENAPAVAKANREMRSIGLGAMNLHGFLAQNGIPYESTDAIEFADCFFAAVNYWSLVRSNELTKETGSTFYGFDGSAYSDGTYFAQYLAADLKPKSEKVAKLFEGIKLPTVGDWTELMYNVMRYGLYHSYRLAIAPTGSISYVQSATASVMPIMERIEERTYGNSKTYYPMPGLSPKTWFLYKEAYDMDMFKVVDLIATIQRHVDQGISFTLFLKDTMTTRDLTRIDLYAHHRGIKSLYYARTKDTTQDACLSCQV